MLAEQRRADRVRRVTSCLSAIVTLVALADDIEPGRARDHRGDVDVPRPGAVDLGTVDLGAKHARLLTRRLDLLLGHAAGGESLPLVIDDALRDIARSDRPALLELLDERSARQQIVLLADDEEIATWARLDALAGRLSVIAPVATGPARRTGASA